MTDQQGPVAAETRCAGLFYLETMSGKNDTLLAVWVLIKLGWSFRRIARLALPTSHHTVKHCHEMASELIEAGELPIMAKSEKALKIIHCGTSQDVEYLEGKIHQNTCGGGRRAQAHDSDEDD